MYGDSYDVVATPPVVHHNGRVVNFDPIPLNKPSLYDYSDLYSDNMSDADRAAYTELVSAKIEAACPSARLVRWYGHNPELGHSIYSGAKFRATVGCTHKLGEPQSRR
jgi:hypothetical protein